MIKSYALPQSPLSRSKSSLMYVSILGLWIFICALLDPKLFSLFSLSLGFFPNFMLLLFTICLNLFWLFGSYYLMLGIFTLIATASKIQPPPLLDFPQVAILYTTMNDFMAAAALSCVEQDYPNFHVFILDDSSDASDQKRVDQFAQNHANRVTVLRRADRKGFKAGSLNHALKHHLTNYPYFAVVDADSVSPKDFIKKMLPYFSLDPTIAYVQGGHRPNPLQKTRFAQELCLGIEPLWTVYYGPRNQFGNVIFLGHGGLIRYDVWALVGGFPELVSEDLAFSTRVAQLGYRGYFATDVISFEDFPEGYRQLRRQQEKYIKGACEYFHKEFVPFVRNPKITWYDKFDIFLSCSSLFMPVLFLFFIIIYCIGMPVFFHIWKTLTLELGSHSYQFPVLLIHHQFNALWSWDFYLVTLFCTFAPTLGSLALLVRYPVRAAKMLLLSSVPYLSLMVVALAALISYLFSGKATFLVTGDRLGADPRRWPRDFSPQVPISQRLGAEDILTKFLELIFGVALIIMCLFTLNLTLLAFSLTLFMAPLLVHLHWESPLLRPFLYLPFLLICCGIVLSGADLITTQAMFMCIFPFHF